MQKQAMYHQRPNKFAQEMEQRALSRRIRGAKSTLDLSNRVFLQKLEERQRRGTKKAGFAPTCLPVRPATYLGACDMSVESACDFGRTVGI